MAISIRSPFSSLLAQRQLAMASSDASTAMERLASGQRTLRASDDPAGLGLSGLLKVSGLITNRSLKNLNDGISLLNVTETALQNLKEIVTRQQELAQQAATGTLGSAQRAALNNEARALHEEYSRVLSSASFNGINLLENSGSARIQHGIGSENSTVLRFSVNAPDSSATLLTAGPSVPSNYSAADVAIADFDNDGHLDLIGVTPSDYEIGLYRGNGDGTFAPVVSLFEAYSYNAEAADLDNDGLTDFVTGGGYIYTFENTGGGTFAAPNTYDATGVPLGMTIADIDNDTFKDLIVTVSDDVLVYRNQGDGTFGPEDRYRADNKAAGVAAGDFNGDGYKDLAVANSNSNVVSVLMNRGDGSFDTQITFDVFGVQRGVAIADVNNDNKLDLLSASEGANALVIFIGNGDGTFETPSTISLGLNPQTILTGDFNADGETDVVIGYPYYDAVSVLTGNGNGTFAAAESYATSDAPVGLKAGDLDEDGLPDLAVATVTGEEINIFLSGGSSGLEQRELDLTTASSAQATLTYLSALQESIQHGLGEAGVFRSRLGVVSSYLSVLEENYAAAYARVADADVAEEAAKLLQAQIRQQAATAILAQANQQAALVLPLLKL